MLLSALSVGYFAAQQVAGDARIAIEESLGHQARLLKQLYDPLILGRAPLPTIESDQRITVLAPDGTVLSDNREDVALMESHLKYESQAFEDYCETLAEVLGLKLMLPLFICFCPAFLILCLGPMVHKLSELN